MKRLGLGTYRMIAGNPVHEECMKRAIRGSAFQVVDTSPNYADGLAEVLVGNVLEELGASARKVEVTTKFGFIQGLTLEKHKQVGFKNAEEYTPDCYYSIDPDFMRHELEGSLQRLRLGKIDTYLVHNPEHLIMGKISPETVSKDGKAVAGLRSELLDKLKSAFVSLEEEVRNGRIEKYGVSSNSFSLPEEHAHFVPFDKLPGIAQEAADLVGNGTHSLKVLQFPGNVLERTALCPKHIGGNGCVQFARANGIETVVNRALTAFDSTGSWRLADGDFPKEYAVVRDRLLEHLSPPTQNMEGWSAEEKKEWEETLEASVWLSRLISDLDSQIGAFSSVMHYQDDLMRKIVPMINSKLEGMDENTSELLFMFFSVYEKGVRSIAGEQTRTHIIEDLSNDKLLQAHMNSTSEDFVLPLLPVSLTEPTPLQEYALKWLLNQPGVNTVLLGAVRPEYVDMGEALLLSHLNGESQ